MDSVATGDVTYGDKAELLDVQYAETTRQAGVLTKAAIAIASGGNAWLSFGLNTVADAAISGEIDLENVVKDAAFTYVSAEFSSLTKTKLGIPAPVEGQYFNQTFIQNAVIDATVNAKTQTAIYGGSFSENLTDAYETALINETTAFAQNKIGKFKTDEGTIDGILLHGITGCASSDLSGGNCGRGFVAAAGSELGYGILYKQNDGDKVAANAGIRQLKPVFAALTSGGDLGQFSINQGIADSQLANNHMTQLESQGYASYYDQFVDQNCQQLSATECRAQYNDGLLKSVRIILDEIPIVGEGMAGYECWSSPGAFICGGIFAGIIPLGKRGLDVVEEGAEQLQKKLPPIKPGTANGPSAGKVFPKSVKDAAKAENPTATCVYCGTEGAGVQVDHAIPRARGGNATLDNAQLACKHCNPSKGSRDFPQSPPPDYVGPWPPKHW